VRDTRLRSLVALVALAVLFAGCGSDRGDDPTAGDSGGGDGNGDQAGATDAAASDDAAARGDNVAFGDLDSPCGPADETVTAGGATDQGVTENQIIIGYGDDAGYAVSPGLSHEASDAIAAMI